MYFKYSTGLIPLKKGRGRGAQGTKATDAPKQTNVACKKTTDASKKKQPNRNLVHHDESEGEQENRPSGRKKRTPRAVVIQEPPSIPVKKTQVSSGKLKGIKLLSDATRLEIDTCRAIKASKRESKFQHQTGGLSEGAGLRPEVPDELTRKYSDKGAGTSPEVPDESKDKNKARDDLEDYCSTDDETFLFDNKEEKPEDISWVRSLRRAPKKRDGRDDQDKDPSTGPNQGKKTNKRRFNESKSSKKTSTTKESSKDTADETQADVVPKILKKDWFKDSPKPEVLDPDWNTVKIIDDAPEQSWFNEMVQAEKPPLTFDELMSTLMLVVVRLLF
ncbi:hypothetical protein Tco_0692105 [Tanacetum coccineum]